MPLIRLTAALALIFATPALAAPEPGSGYTLRQLTPSLRVNIVHGIRVGKDGQLYASSLFGRTIHRIDPVSGRIDTVIPPPHGAGDDLVFSPDGRQLVWSSFFEGILYTRRGDGPIEKLASDWPNINSMAFSRDGKRLFAAQAYGQDALWELDPAGVRPPRKIAENIGSMNAFDIGPDGKIYGPLATKGQIARVDPETGVVETIATGFHHPTAVKFDAQDRLHAIDSSEGALYRIDIATGQKLLLVKVAPALDNFAIDPKSGRFFLTNFTNNGVQEFDPATGKVRDVYRAAFSFPSDIDVATIGGRELLFVADAYAYRSFDPATGRMTDLARVTVDPDIVGSAEGISMNGDHNVLTESTAIQIFDRATNKPIRTIRGFSRVADALEMADGSVIVSGGRSGTLTRIAPDDTRKTVAEGLAMPLGLLKAADGAVYVAESGAGRILRVDAAGKRTITAAGLDRPKAMAWLADGRIAVLEAGAGRVTAIDIRAAGRRTTIATGIPTGMETAPLMPGGGIAVGGKGQVYIVSEEENALYEVTRK